MQGRLPLVSRTCCTPGKCKQLSDVNRDYPVGGPGPGPSMCRQRGKGADDAYSCSQLTPAVGLKPIALTFCRVARHCACPKVAGSCTALKSSDKQSARCLTWKTLTSLCGLQQRSNKLKGKESRIESNAALLFL